MRLALVAAALSPACAALLSIPERATDSASETPEAGTVSAAEAGSLDSGGETPDDGALASADLVDLLPPDHGWAPHGLTTSGALLVFSDIAHRDIVKIPKAGGAPTVLVTDPFRAFSLAADETRVCWAPDESASPTATVRCMSIAQGQSPAVIYSAAESIGALVMTSTHLFFSQLGVVYRVEKLPDVGSFGTPQKIASLPGANDSIRSLLIDGDDLFLASPRGLYRTPANSEGSPVALSAEATAIHVDASSVYWLEGNAVRMTARSGDGGEGSVVLVTGQDAPHAMVGDASRIYWVSSGASDGNNGTLRTCKKTACGETLQTVAEGLSGLGQLVIDADYVYVALTGGSRRGVLRVRKRP